MDELEARFSALANHEFSAGEARLQGVRIVHRQKLGKTLVFLGLRGANGALVECILRDGVFETDGEPPTGKRLDSNLVLGDAVRVTGLVERSKDRLSMHARRIETCETWAELFGPRALFRDDVLHGTGLPPSLWAAAASGEIVLLQVAGSHATRMQEYLHATLGVDTLAIIAPISGPKCHRDERCLLIRTPRPARLVCSALGDPTLQRCVQRWYVVESMATTFAEACEGLLRVLTRLRDSRRLATGGGRNAAEAPHGSGGSASDGGGDDERLQVRVQAFPKDLEARLVDRLRASGLVDPVPKGACLACVVFMYGAMAIGLADGADGAGGDTSFQEAFLATNHAGVMPHARPGRTATNRPPEPNQKKSRLDAPLPASADGATAGAVDGGGGGGGGGGSGADGVICRAFYKLREVALRLGLRLEVEHAIDVGASPGGWTTCLCDAGCARVTAVDPGALYLPPALAASGRVEHLQMRIEAALPLLHERGGVRLDLLVCDMNAPPEVVVAIAHDASPLLVDGAALVLTFKNS